MPTYDYRCEDGHVVELRRGMDVESIPCPQCGEDAPRVPFYASVELITETGVKSGHGIFKRPEVAIRDKNGRVRLDLFEEAASEMQHNQDKAEENAGRRIRTPSLYKTGAAMAVAMRRRGYRSIHERTDRADS